MTTIWSACPCRRPSCKTEKRCGSLPKFQLIVAWAMSQKKTVFGALHNAQHIKFNAQHHYFKCRLISKFADATFAASRPRICRSPIGCNLLLNGCDKLKPALSKSLRCLFRAAERVPQGGARWTNLSSDTMNFSRNPSPSSDPNVSLNQTSSKNSWRSLLRQSLRIAAVSFSDPEKFQCKENF